VALSEPMTGKDVERKRRISPPDESHSDSESTSLMSHNQLSSAVQLLPRPRSSASMIDLIDSSTPDTAKSVEHLVSDVTVSTASVCTAMCHIIYNMLFIASISCTVASSLLKLLDKLLQTPTLNSFRCNLKTHLFSTVLRNCTISSN